MSADRESKKRNTIILIICLAASAVAVVVVLAAGMFLVTYLYPTQPQDKMAQLLTEPPPPPPPPPISTSPQPPGKISSGHSASQSPNHSKRVVLSAAVAQSLLIMKNVPNYPPIARAARISGTVVLHAVVSTWGSVMELSVVSGSPMLQQAALDAVKTWKYRPYLLNGEPVEFETTINVVFLLGD